MRKLLSINKSTKKDKKLQAIFEVDGKQRTIHFGATGYNDYTIYYKTEGKSVADKKKDAYLARHKVNETWNDPMTAGSLSRWVLWNKPSISASISDFKKRFSL
jgi:hypothetical protein